MMGETSRDVRSAHGAFVGDVAEVLDLSAGLRAAMLAQRHRRFADDIEQIVDLERGAALITRDERCDVHMAGVDGNAAERRLRARTSALLARSVLYRIQVELHEMRGLLRAAKWIHARRHERGTPRPSESGVRNVRRKFTEHAIRIEVELKKVGAVSRAIAEATRSVPLVREAELESVRKLVEASNTSLAAWIPSGEVVYICGKVIRKVRMVRFKCVDRVNGVLDATADFTGADLRSVDLTAADLTGIRWSSATRWPPGWHDRVRSISHQLGPDLYEITRGAQHDAHIPH